MDTPSFIIYVRVQTGLLDFTIATCWFDYVELPGKRGEGGRTINVMLKTKLNQHVTPENRL